MSQIRKQSIVSSIVVYIGFAIGFFNTYLFTRQGGFSQGEYGLVGIFMAVANIMYSFANLGMSAYITKFFPYYNDNLPRKKNDMLTWALLFSLVGFCLVVVVGLYFKDVVIRKYGTNSPDFVRYYYYIFPFGLGLTFFSILEAYAWQLKRSVFSNFLKEVFFRLLATLLILLCFAGFITSFDLFIKLYSFTFLAVALILFADIILSGKASISFSVSRVTKKFFRKIATLVAFIYGGNLVFSISLVFDTIVIAAVLPDGLAMAGIYTLAQNIASLIQAPQRGVISSSVGPLSKAWKDKDMLKIERIYRSSSINQLLFAVAMFALIWMNFDDAVLNFRLQHRYLEAAWVFFFIGLMRIVDMGTGVNSQIIATSTLWRFDFITGIILLSLTMPLNYFFTKYYYGVTGPAIANLICLTLYNSIRYWFLFKKFRLQPFTVKSGYTILLGLGAFFICYFGFRHMHGFAGMTLRSALFITLFAIGVKLLDLSPDVKPVWQTLLKKLGVKKGD